MFEALFKSMGINPDEIKTQIHTAAVKIQQIESAIKRIDSNQQIILDYILNGTLPTQPNIVEVNHD